MVRTFDDMKIIQPTRIGFSCVSSAFSIGYSMEDGLLCRLARKLFAHQLVSMSAYKYSYKLCSVTVRWMDALAWLSGLQGDCIRADCSSELLLRAAWVTS